MKLIVPIEIKRKQKNCMLDGKATKKKNARQKKGHFNHYMLIISHNYKLKKMCLIVYEPYFDFIMT